MAKTLYFNIEDDIEEITEKIKHEKAEHVVLVFPKKSYLFSDGVNLKMLKKQMDLLKKTAAILTMDERGQVYAKDAGFELKFLPGAHAARGLGDITVQRSSEPEASHARHHAPKQHAEPEVKKVIRVKKPKPQVRHTGALVPKIEVRDTIFPDLSPTAELIRERTSRKDYRKKAFIGAVSLALIFAVLLVTVILPKATIVVYAKTDPVARDVEVTLSSTATNPDVSKLILPATSVSTKLESNEKFNTLGKKEVGSKAEGKVRIFNFSSSPLNLKAATTTLSVGDKKYVFTEDQNNIKVLQAKQATDPNAGHLAVIMAVEGGGSFNLVSGARMEITNQVFGSKPEFLYARTEGEITGGNSRFLSIVTEDDIAKSKESLTTTLVEQFREQLEQEGRVLAEKAFSTEVTSFTTNKPVGTESPAFEASIELEIKGVSYNKNELHELLRNRISQMLPENKQLQAAGLDTINVKVKAADVSAGNYVVIAHFESQAIDIVETEELLAGLKGKTKEEASEILLARPEIGKVDIILSPSWQNSVPRFSSKITIERK